MAITAFLHALQAIYLKAGTGVYFILSELPLVGCGSGNWDEKRAPIPKLAAEHRGRGSLSYAR
jgi:hypothetical protein